MRCIIRTLSGIKVERGHERRMLRLSQEAYVNKLLSRFNLGSSNASIPMCTDLQLRREKEVEIENAKNFPCAEFVGSLMYLACTTRSDISYVLYYLARYFAFHDHEH